MKKILMIMAAVALVVSGCKSIEVEKRGQQLALDQNGSVVRRADGNPVVLDQGWEVDYFQHWNWQKFDALEAVAGSASLKINNYQSGADTNLPALVGTSLDGATKLVVAVSEAYTTIAGGGAQASTALSVSQKVLEYATSNGVDLSKATISTTGGKLTITDGTKAVQCDSSGNCTSLTDSTASTTTTE